MSWTAAERSVTALHVVQDSASIRAGVPAAGHSPLSTPYVSATWRSIANDSNMGTPPSTSAGTCPLGLIARNSGFFCSPADRSILTLSYGIFSSSIAQWIGVELV